MPNGWRLTPMQNVKSVVTIFQSLCKKFFFLLNLINVLDPLRIWTSLHLQFGIILEPVTVHTIFKPIEKLIYRCWPMFVSFWITFSSFVVNYMRIVRSTLVNEYDSSRLGQAQKRQRCHACVSVTVKHIMYAKNAYVVTFFSCFKCDDIVGLCDFFEMSLSLCIQTAFELKIWRAFCVSGDTFSISNLHRI